MTRDLEASRLRLRQLEATEKVLNALDIITLTSLPLHRKRAEAARAYVDAVKKSIDAMARDAELREQLTRRDETRPPLVVVVTASSGLVGDFNREVLRSVDEYVQGQDPSTPTPFVALGSKGADYLVARGVEPVAEWRRPTDEISMPECDVLAAAMLRAVRQGQVREIVYVYTHYIDPFTAEPRRVQCYPVDLPALSGSEDEISAVDFEPEARATVEGFVRHYASGLLYACLQLSRASESMERRAYVSRAKSAVEESIEEARHELRRLSAAAELRSRPAAADGPSERELRRNRSVHDFAHF